MQVRGWCVGVVTLGVLGVSGAALAQPSNDRCENARVISANMTISGSNIGATSDVNGTSCTGFLDPFDIWFSFTAPTSGDYAFDTLGSNFDTTLAAYEFCTSGLIMCNDNATQDDTWSQIFVTMNQGQTVLIRLAGLFGDEGRYELFGVPPTPPAGLCCFGVTCFTPAMVTECAGPNRQFLAMTTCNAGGDAITPCCRADYNKQGGVTVQDVFDFLGDWFNGARSADWVGNGAGTPTVQSVFDYLTAWFAGGC